jgi:hypothetical protein
VKTARIILLILIAAFLLFNVVMIPLLIANGTEVLDDCIFSIFDDFDWRECGSAVGSETVGWFAFKWFNFLLLGGIVATGLTMIGLAIYNRTTRPQRSSERRWRWQRHQRPEAPDIQEPEDNEELPFPQ